MLDKLSYRWAVVIVIILLGAFWISPNFVHFGKKSIFGKNRITPGLDIQGGIHLVMGVDVQEVLQERVARMAKNLIAEFKDNGVAFKSVTVGGDDKSVIEIEPSNQQSADAIAKFLKDKYPATLQVSSQTPSLMEVKYFDAVIQNTKKQVVNQAIEVIRNRIDEFGVAEPNISAEGSDRILVQLPGIQDAARAKELINRTARLDFRVVSTAIPTDKLVKMIADAEKQNHFELAATDETAQDHNPAAGATATTTAATADHGAPNANPADNGAKSVQGAGAKNTKAETPIEKLHYQAYVNKLNDVLAAQLPKETRIVFEKLDNAENLAAGRRPYLIRTDSNLTGAELEDASVRNDEYGRPEVDFRFTLTGRKMFADLTSKAAGGSLAIVLDDVVKSAPHVEREIDSDSARITLGGGRDYDAMFNEARFIALALRAGALPAALEPLEERTVGPSLGSESIHKAKIASMIGTMAVFIWMFLYYRGAGLIADISLIINIFLTFAVLTSMGATLDLPGVAGIALTIGMAVDANVIIYERVKEELRKGASLAGAVRDGYHNAYPSIFDANLCTVLTCAVLMYFGTGPIRGFAVTLAIGMVTSMFTAVFFSRTVMETIVGKFNYNVFTVPVRANSATVNKS